MILTNKKPKTPQYVISKEIEGRKAKIPYIKYTFIFLFLVFISSGCMYSVIAGRASAYERDIVEPMGNGAGSSTQVIYTDTSLTPDERKRICGLDSVTCGKVKTMTVSAYTSEVGQTDASPEVGATGENIYKLLQKGIRTCASNDYKFGTKLIIPGIGECVVKDRMNRRYTGKNVVDVYLGYDTARAWKWGRKRLQVEVVE